MKIQSSVYRKTIISFYGIDNNEIIWTFDNELEAVKASNRHSDFIKITSSPLTIMELNLNRVKKIEPLKEIRHKRSPLLTVGDRFIYHHICKYGNQINVSNKLTVNTCMLALKLKNMRDLNFKFLDNQNQIEDLFATSISLFNVIKPKFEEFNKSHPLVDLCFAEYHHS